MMRIITNAGELARALGLAALRVDELTLKRVPALGAVRIKAYDAVEIAGNVLDFAVTAKADAEIAESGEIAVSGAALATLAAGFSDGSKVMIAAENTATVTCGRSRYRLPLFPLDNLPAPLVLDGDIGTAVTIEGAALSRLLGAHAVADKEVTRYYLNGILLRSVGDDLHGIATDSRRLVRIATRAGHFSPDRDLTVPLRAATVLDKLINRTRPDEVTLCRSKALLAVKSADVLFVTKLIDGIYPDYTRVIPKPSDNTVEVERAELLAALGRLAAVAKAAGQAAVTALEWGDGGALLLYLANDIADDAVAGEGRGRGQVAMAIESFIDLLEAIDGKRIVLDAGSRADPMRIGVAGNGRVLALQMPCTFHFRPDTHQTNEAEE
jgi:DNA polymerase-3 subunit beta